MKRIITVLAAVMITARVFAQTPPQLMSYQAVIRDANGNLVKNSSIGMQVSILQGGPLGNVVYEETYSSSPQTNTNGLVTVEIGSGTPTGTLTFSSISWGSGTYYIKTETDPTGGTDYTITGTSQLLSVPYALYAANGGTAGATGPTGANGATGMTGLQGIAGTSVNWTGTYSAGTTYNSDDGVSYDGISYVSLISDNKGNIPSNSPTDWQVIAQVGAQGATGNTGEQGLAGHTGAIGNTGEQGIAGATGNTGEQGIAGATGANGNTGVQGIAGQTGATGNSGEQGIAGQTGANGNTGEQGLAGPTGLVGTTGATGTFDEIGTTGQTIYNNGTTWVASSTITNNGTNVGINNTAPVAQLQVSNGAVLFDGTYSGTGTTPTSGPGDRMMWIPSKGAFRAGYVNGSQWNDANIGNYSFSAGYNSTASNASSIALGGTATASGDGAIALGYSTASGYGATALGYNTTASGDYSTALGGNTTASGDGATALGYSTASGYGATALGYNTTASGDYSTALGVNTTASGDGATALGNYTQATGDNSTSLGAGTTAQAWGSTVLGVYNVVSGTTGNWTGTDPLFVIGNGSPTTPSNAMTVLQNGLVGIGTTAPQQNLSVNGAINIDQGRNNNGTNIQPGLSFGSSSGEGIASNRVSGANVDGLDFYTAGAKRLSITQSGYVGIGTSNPGSLLSMEASGGGYYSTGDHSWHNGSSIRWKENIKPIKNAIATVMQLRGVSYDWKKQYGGNHSIGFIAEEIGKVVPEVVEWDKNAPQFANGVNYGNITALLAAAIQEQQKTIEMLKNENKELKADNDKIKSDNLLIKSKFNELDKMKAEIESLKGEKTISEK